jgi:hypothetical protein
LPGARAKESMQEYERLFKEILAMLWVLEKVGSP